MEKALLTVAIEDFDYYVLEVSSFQLDDIQNFRPYISLLLNLSQDHLDQYNYNYEEYALAKFRIAENQRMTIISSTIKMMK